MRPMIDQFIVNSAEEVSGTQFLFIAIGILIYVSVIWYFSSPKKPKKPAVIPKNQMALADSIQKANEQFLGELKVIAENDRVLADSIQKANKQFLRELKVIAENDRVLADSIQKANEQFLGGLKVIAENERVLADRVQKLQKTNEQSLRELHAIAKESHVLLAGIKLTQKKHPRWSRRVSIGHTSVPTNPSSPGPEIPESPFDGDSIDSLNLSSRVRNGLVRAGIKTIRDVRENLYSGGLMWSIRNFGEKSLDELREKVRTKIEETHNRSGE